MGLLEDCLFLEPNHYIKAVVPWSNELQGSSNLESLWFLFVFVILLLPNNFLSDLFEADQAYRRYNLMQPINKYIND